ncbi:MAG: ArsR/SmtB family transcription factor [Acidimicrobiia bacterium]
MTSFERQPIREGGGSSSLPATNITTLPRVKDLTAGEARITLETDGSGIYDMLLTIWSIFDDDDDHSSFELGPEWFSEIAASLPEDLRQELDFLGGPGAEAWLSLAGLIATSPYPHDIDSVLAWLRQIDPIELRAGILMHKCGGHADDGMALAEKAAGGDGAALDELLATGKMADRPDVVAGYRELMAVPMPELRDRMGSALGTFRTQVYEPFEKTFGQATTRAAAARRALARGAHPEKVIEEVTNGLDYRIQPGVSRLVLVPSVVLRPWALIDQHRSTLTVVYAAADEFIDADPDAPPSWVVKLHKALGDERRLRILRRLSEGGASLDDLSEMLALTKSTVHHHVGLLRAAGLVRVSIDPAGPTKLYTLRPAVLPEARRTLDDYLRTAERIPQE